MLTQEKLKELFYYEPETGDLIWRLTQNGRAMVGGTAGRKSGRYLRIGFNGKQYSAHHLVWILHNGPIPTGIQIDHIDRDGFNNRIQNLRSANQSQNMWNTGMNKSNTSGAKGVAWDKSNNKWKAQLRFKGKSVHVGFFSDFDEAVSSVRAKREELHGEFVNHG